MDQLVCLLRQRFNEYGMAVAEADRRRPTEEVEILAAGVVPEARALAADGEQRHPPPGLHEVLRFFFAPVGHVSILFEGRITGCAVRPPSRRRHFGRSAMQAAT